MKALELYNLIENLLMQEKIDDDTEIGLIISDNDTPCKFEFRKVLTLSDEKKTTQILILKWIGKYEL